MTKRSDPTQAGQASESATRPEMPEIRLLLSLRSHQYRTRRRLALCDDLCTSLDVLYRAALALSTSGLGSGEDQDSDYVNNAPASAHTICSMVRDFAAALNQVIELVEPDVGNDEDEPAGPADSSVAPVVHQTLFKALDEHTGLRNWKDVSWIGLECGSGHRLEFQWSTAMTCLRKNPQKGCRALRPAVLLARRLADEAMSLLDPAAGPITEERAAAYSVTKKLRAQINHVRTLVNRKCDTLEREMRSVQSAIIKAQSQTMSLAKNLSKVGNSAD